MVLSISRTGIIRKKFSSIGPKNQKRKIAPKKYFRGGDLKHPMHSLHHEIADFKLQYGNNRKTEIL